jgi:glycine/D-amino acid oxidase-like deaminating enzyme
MKEDRAGVGGASLFMDRRALLAKGGLVLAGLALGGCAPGVSSISAVRPRRRLAPVRAGWDRVIRTTVGLRPYRPSGFVVRADKLGDKTLVHDYGHGGSGMSLSWGTAALAAELALSQPERRAAVIGCGVAGLTATRELQRRGFDVTIYAMSVPPDTTSNMSLAAWTPTSGLVDDERRTSAWDAQLRRAAEISYTRLQLLVGRGYGVSWLERYALRDSRPRARSESDEEPLLPAHLNTGAELLGPGEHPFPTSYASVRTQIRIEPSIYLDALVRDVHAFGGRVVIRGFRDLREVAALEEPVVVNCAGLGAGALFGDLELTPVKGQLTVLAPQPEVDYGTFGALTPSGADDVGFHMQPRADGIVLGGTSREGEWSLEPDEEARRAIVDAHIELFRAMG